MNQIYKWMLNHKKKVVLFIMLFLILILVLLVPKVPNYIEMYKNVQRAQISLLNDDLEGGLLSYEKAYEYVPNKALINDIEEVKELITSKSSFLKAQKFEGQYNYETAYYYYQQVIPQDERRYSEAQDKVIEMANEIVDSIYQQVEELYENRLFLMIIGRLQHALDYGVKVEETNQKIAEYQKVLFDYYIKRAKQESTAYFNHEMFYDLYAKSLEEAKKYAVSQEMVDELSAVKESLMNENIEAYYDLAIDAYHSSELDKVDYYHEILNQLAPDSEKVKELEHFLSK